MVTPNSKIILLLKQNQKYGPAKYPTVLLGISIVWIKGVCFD